MHLPNLPWKWEKYFENCCRITILDTSIIMHGVIRMVPDSFDHLVGPLLKLLHFLSSSLNYLPGNLERMSSHDQGNILVWNGAILEWFGICLGEHLEFQETLCTGKGAESEC